MTLLTNSKPNVGTLAELYGSVIRNLFGRHNQFVFVVIIRKSHDGVTVIFVNNR